MAAVNLEAVRVAMMVIQKFLKYSDGINTSKKRSLKAKKLGSGVSSVTRAMICLLLSVMELKLYKCQCV